MVIRRRSLLTRREEGEKVEKKRSSVGVLKIELVVRFCGLISLEKFYILFQQDVEKVSSLCKMTKFSVFTQTPEKYATFDNLAKSNIFQSFPFDSLVQLSVYCRWNSSLGIE